MSAFLIRLTINLLRVEAHRDMYVKKRVRIARNSMAIYLSELFELPGKDRVAREIRNSTISVSSFRRHFILFRMNFCHTSRKLNGRPADLHYELEFSARYFRIKC